MHKNVKVIFTNSLLFSIAEIQSKKLEGWKEKRNPAANL